MQFLLITVVRFIKYKTRSVWRDNLEGKRLNDVLIWKKQGYSHSAHYKLEQIEWNLDWFLEEFIGYNPGLCLLKIHKIWRQTRKALSAFITSFSIMKINEPSTSPLIYYIFGWAKHCNFLWSKSRNMKSVSVKLLSIIK